MDPKEEWVTVKGVPTHVQTWGGWITDLPPAFSEVEKNPPIVLLLSGNPGIIKYYYSFLQAVYKILAVPVWVLSHAGHEKVPKGSAAGTTDLNNVVFQVDHKAEFIREYIPPNRDIYIIAHSFGAKITVELLKQSTIGKQIKKCYLLFPTLERIGDTINGHKIKVIVKYFLSIITFLSFLFTLLPYTMRWWMVKTYFAVSGRRKIDPNCIAATLELINPTSLRNVFTLASNEMDVIRELDKEVIENCVDKLRVYFGTTDNWAPLDYHYNLIEQVPKVDSNILDSKYEHCFVLEAAEDIALYICDRIKNDIANSKE